MTPNNHPADKAAQEADEGPANATHAPDTDAVPPEGDACHDDRALKKNRQRLGIDEEHKTPDMQKGHRGTFP